MGWEVMKNETHNGQFKRWCFFCNTGDVAFGDIFFLNDCVNEAEFYQVRGKVNPNARDPRIMTDKERWHCVLRMKAHYDGDDIITDYLDDEKEIKEVLRGG